MALSLTGEWAFLEGEHTGLGLIHRDAGGFGDCGLLQPSVTGAG